MKEHTIKTKVYLATHTYMNTEVRLGLQKGGLNAKSSYTSRLYIDREFYPAALLTHHHDTRECICVFSACLVIFTRKRKSSANFLNDSLIFFHEFIDKECWLIFILFL